MTDRREFLQYVGTTSIGLMAGYYVGAKELLGIQSTETPQAGNAGIGDATDTLLDAATLYGCVGSKIYTVGSDGDVSIVVDGVDTKGLAAASDKTFWLTQQDSSRTEEHIRNVNTEGEILTQFLPPDEGTRGIEVDNQGIVGPQGRLYVVGHFSERIVEMTQDGSVTNEYAVPAFEIVGISIDGDGNIWLTNQNANLVYRTEPAGAELRVLDEWDPQFENHTDNPEVRENPHPAGIAVDGNSVWLTDKNGAAIYRYNRGGELLSSIELRGTDVNMRALDTL